MIQRSSTSTTAINENTQLDGGFIIMVRNPPVALDHIYSAIYIPDGNENRVFSEEWNKEVKSQDTVVVLNDVAISTSDLDKARFIMLGVKDGKNVAISQGSWLELKKSLSAELNLIKSIDR